MSVAVSELLPLTDNDIAFISCLAIEAGQLAAQMREGVGISHKTGPDDLVTEADHALSKLITNGISERFSQDVIISEEDDNHHKEELTRSVWLIDPIDGTDNYVKNDGQYCVMIGLLVDLKPIFGWVYGPADDVLYFGGPNFGTFRQSRKEEPIACNSEQQFPDEGTIRVAMGRRDRRKNPWITEIPRVDWLTTGSIGLKVAKILDDEADIFVHLSGKLKVWDSAGPTALALGAGLDVGTMTDDHLTFPLPAIRHEGEIVIGKRGSLNWSRTHLKQSKSD